MQRWNQHLYQVGHRQARSKSFRIGISFWNTFQNNKWEISKRSSIDRHSFKNCKLQSWKISFCARRPSKTARRRCWNENVVRDILPTLQVEDVKTKLSCETSRKSDSWRVKTKLSCENSRKSDSWRGENEAFVRDFPQKLKVADVKGSFCARLPSKKWNLPLSQRSFRAQTIACATLGLCDPRGTLSPSHHLRPYSKNIVPAASKAV